MARLTSLTVLSIALVVVIHHSARPLLTERHDLRPVSERLGAWQEQGVPLAYVGTYHGQFHFMGRLKTPIAALGKTLTDLPDWLAANPDGQVITIAREPAPETTGTISYPYRGRYLVIIDVATAIANPSIFEQ